jgi:hypothetical protein
MKLLLAAANPAPARPADGRQDPARRSEPKGGVVVEACSWPLEGAKRFPKLTLATGRHSIQATRLDMTKAGSPREQGPPPVMHGEEAEAELHASPEVQSKGR